MDPPEVRILDGRIDDQIDRPVEKPPAGTNLTIRSKRPRTAATRERIELDQKIEIAFSAADPSPTAGGAEKLQAPDMVVAAQLIDDGLALCDLGTHGNLLTRITQPVGRGWAKTARGRGDLETREKRRGGEWEAGRRTRGRSDWATEAAKRTQDEDAG